MNEHSAKPTNLPTTMPANITTKYPSAYQFPHPEAADPDGHGMIAMGGDLEPTTLLHAYSTGLFPWFSEDEPIAWWSPDPRCVFYPEDFAPKKSLKKNIKKSGFQVSVNGAFEEVISICAHIRAETDGTWITDDMIAAYTRLHDMGYAHSVEVWAGDSGEANASNAELVGGLYGIKLGNAFFGESMFHTRTDASKMAFAFLMKLARESGMALVDGQLENPHLMSLGAVLIHRQTFLNQLAEIMQHDTVDWSSITGKRFDVVSVLDEGFGYLK